MDDKLKGIDPDIIKAIKDSVLDELKTEAAKTAALRAQQQEQDRIVHEEYVEKMKASTEPWVDIVSWAEGEHEVETKLDWNDAFIADLRASGFTGANDEQIIQQYLVILSKNMASKMDDESDKKGDFE
jgi:hypothetical protein